MKYEMAWHKLDKSHTYLYEYHQEVNGFANTERFYLNYLSVEH